MQSAADEFARIERIRRSAKGRSRFVRMGVGDDCAVLQPLPGESLVVTTDQHVENVHFRRSWIHPKILGRRALRSSLSDLSAMGAEPRAFLLSVALPAELGDEYLASIVEGVLEDSSPLDLPLAGGDLSASQDIVVSVTAIGGVDSEPMLRSKARPGDTIGVCGRLGWARLGLEILEAGGDRVGQLSSSRDLLDWAGARERGEAVLAHLLPPILLSSGNALRTAGCRAAIDVSDGLGQDLGHLLRESGVGAELDLEALEGLAPPESPDRRLRLALEGGEDYALLFAATPTLTAALDVDWTRIGTVIDAPPEVWLGRGPERRPYRGRGYDHFA